MENEKKLVINCQVLDTRRLDPAQYARYESIEINAMRTIHSPASRGLCLGLPISGSFGKTMVLDSTEPVRACFINGAGKLGGGEPLAENTCVMINGTAEFQPDAAQMLKSCLCVMVNGTAWVPEELLSALPGLDVNGELRLIPRGAVCLKESFVLDGLFPRRARQGGRYFASERILALPEAELAILREKGVRLLTKKLVLPAEQVEDGLALVDEQAEIRQIPAGWAVCPEDTALDERFLARYGRRVFVEGDLEILERAPLEALEGLEVDGTVTVTRALAPLLDRLGAKYEQLQIIGGEMGDCPQVYVDRAALDVSPDGLVVRSCAKVVLSPELTAQEIRDKLAFRACAWVQCTEEQRGAVSLVSQMVAEIGPEAVDAAGLAQLGPTDARQIYATVHVL